jgi:hypothetical protein
MRKIGEEDLYNKQSTSMGTKGATIVAIRTKIVHIAAQIIICRVMHKKREENALSKFSLMWMHVPRVSD